MNATMKRAVITEGWKGDQVVLKVGRFRTERAAQFAICKKARQMKLKQEDSHSVWVTRNKEGHWSVVDFGSHVYFGLITDAGNKEKS